MNFLKLFGIDSNLPSLISKALFLIALFGIATSCLYDLLQAIINGDYNLYSFVFYICCILLFIFLIVYNVSALNSASQAAFAKTPGLEKIYNGIVIILSKPYKSPDEIINTICEESSKNPNNPDNLYKEKSIGQLFKGIYKHKNNVKYIWTITTKDTAPYLVCFEKFLDGYVPGTKLVGLKNKGSVLFDQTLLECNEGSEMINNMKDIVSKIYSEENLDLYSLKKSDIILDMSGGTKTMTIGAVFGAIDEEIDIQYVEQTSDQLISVSITPEHISDKILEYLLERSKRTNVPGEST